MMLYLLADTKQKQYDRRNRHVNINDIVLELDRNSEKQWQTASAGNSHDAKEMIQTLDNGVSTTKSSGVNHQQGVRDHVRALEYKQLEDSSDTTSTRVCFLFCNPWLLNNFFFIYWSLNQYYN